MPESTKPTSRLKTIALAISIAVNLVLIGMMFIQKSVEPTGKTGVLTKGVDAHLFGENQILFKLPKGLTVRDESPRGLNAIDMFEPHRFAIVLTSDEIDAVNFSAPKSQQNQHGELYSIQPIEKDEAQSK